MLNEYDKNRRLYPVPPVPKTTSVALPKVEDKRTVGGKGPVQDGWESVNGEDEGPVQAMSNEGPQQLMRWPDGGMHIPSKINDYNKLLEAGLAAIKEKNAAEANVIYPREAEQSQSPASKKIHSFGLDEDIDDQNDQGGLDDLLNDRELAQHQAEMDELSRNGFGSSVEAEETKYGPGNYPDDDEDKPEFFHNLFADNKERFFWVLPNIALGAHPVLFSHQENLSELKKAGIKTIISIFNKPLDLKLREGFNYLSMESLSSAADLKKVCKFIDIEIENRHPIFIHSFSGKGKAATALAAYIVYKGWLTPEESVEWIRQHYNKNAIGPDQEGMLLEFTFES